MPDESALLPPRTAEVSAIGDWPMFGLCADVRGFLAERRAAGDAVVLVTLVSAKGGGPRLPGAQMAVTANDLCGFLSGGCIEADVALHARDCLDDGQPRRLVYGEGSPFFDIQLLCGKRIELFLERIAPDDEALHRLLALTHDRQEALWVSDGQRRACFAAGEAMSEGWDGPDMPEDAGEGRAGIYVRYRPLVRFFVHGHDPSALAMAALAAQAGFETTLVRRDGPRTPPPIAGIAYRRGLPEADAFDDRTAVVVANHDAEADHEALVTALSSGAGYIGLLGARAHLDARQARLLSAGVTPEALKRLKAPVGLPLNSHTPWEIAVSVVAEVMQAFNAPRRG